MEGLDEPQIDRFSASSLSKMLLAYKARYCGVSVFINRWNSTLSRNREAESAVQISTLPKGPYIQKLAPLRSDRLSGLQFLRYLFFRQWLSRNLNARSSPAWIRFLITDGYTRKRYIVHETVEKVEQMMFRRVTCHMHSQCHWVRARAC